MVLRICVSCHYLSRRAWSLTVGVWISVEILTNRLIIRYTKAVCGAVELKVLTC